MRPLRRLLLFAAGGLAALGVAAAIYLDAYLDTPVATDDEVVEFQIESGQPFAHVSRALAERGIITGPRLLSLYARVTGQAGRIHAGDYLIEAGTTHRQLLEKFVGGSVRLYSFTIVEGWNQWNLLQALAAQPQLEATLSETAWPAFLEEIGALAGHPEGLFLPETYRFPRGTTDRELLRQAHELLREVLEEEWGARSESAAVTSPYEALILASIVEKETARSDERARIAGVFARRLEKGMRLQTDPTVIYGIGRDFDGNLRRRDLQTDTPYNTYMRRGLPPTPIAMPGRAAIHAVLHPADGDELYFVATGLGDGSHTFSTTKAEHDAAVADYLRRLREQRRGGQ
jgi:UPF0755 protein